VFLTGDTLQSANLEDLIPYGHLFHELQFGREGRTTAAKQAISNLLVTCSNLRKFRYAGSGDEQDSLVIIAVHQSCPLLEELQISSTPFNQQQQIAGAGAGADAGVFTLIGRNCKHLRKLELSDCRLSASVLRSIAGMESLKDLTLDECEGVTDADITALAKLKLVKLCISSGLHSVDDYEWTEALLQSFVGSNISQTLESFKLSVGTIHGFATPVDDVQVATALASCHNLTTLTVHLGDGGCLFGRNGLDGLQAIATGCPLLADVILYLTVPGLHYIGTHFTNLKKCNVFTMDDDYTTNTPAGYPSIEELQTLYPAVDWVY
jgi:hypothetical protein